LSRHRPNKAPGALECARHPMDDGGDHDSLAGAVGTGLRAQGYKAILPLPPSPAVLTTVQSMSSTGLPTPWPYTGPRRPPRPLSVATRPAAQGRRPIRFRNAQGDLFEAHYVGEFAAQLKKSAATIRRWERQGVLPPAPFEQRLRRGEPPEGSTPSPGSRASSPSRRTRTSSGASPRA